MRGIYLHEDEKHYLYASYKIGERYKVVNITNLEECDHLKIGLKGTLTEISDDGFFIIDWDDGFNSHGEFPNWLERDEIKNIN